MFTSEVVDIQNTGILGICFPRFEDMAVMLEAQQKSLFHEEV